MTERISLAEQCKALSLDLIEMNLSYQGRPEPALLKHFENMGYVGSHIEGYTFQTVLKALMLDKLAELNTFSSRDDACTRYLEAQLTIHKEKVMELISSIRETSRAKFLKNVKEILKQPFIQREYSGLTEKCCIAIFDAVDTEVFIQAANKFAEDPYTYRAGWPDLTLVKGKEVQFIEVKTTDKLHSSQLTTIPAFMQVFPYKFSVYKVLK